MSRDLSPRGQACVSFRRIGGHLLGCFWGNDHDQEDWNLRTDDEVTIASDGLYEQPDKEGTSVGGTNRRANPPAFALVSNDPQRRARSPDRCHPGSIPPG